jgi:hypothetical protein
MVSECQSKASSRVENSAQVVTRQLNFVQAFNLILLEPTPKALTKPGLEEENQQ